MVYFNQNVEFLLNSEYIYDEKVHVDLEDLVEAVLYLEIQIESIALKK